MYGGWSPWFKPMIRPIYHTKTDEVKTTAFCQDPYITARKKLVAVLKLNEKSVIVPDIPEHRQVARLVADHAAG
jgi:hypothetical protein